MSLTGLKRKSVRDALIDSGVRKLVDVRLGLFGMGLTGRHAMYESANRRGVAETLEQ